MQIVHPLNYPNWTLQWRDLCMCDRVPGASISVQVSKGASYSGLLMRGVWVSSPDRLPRINPPI